MRHFSQKAVPHDRLSIFGCLFESLFSVHFENTFPARFLQAISRHMSDNYAPYTCFLPSLQVQEFQYKLPISFFKKLQKRKIPEKNLPL